MALDLLILDTDGYPEMTIPVGIVKHGMLIELAESIGDFQMILRMSDYYGDVEFNVADIPNLLKEFKRLKIEIEENHQIQQQVANLSNKLMQLEQLSFPPITREMLAALLSRLEVLCDIAIREQKSILAQAD